MAPPTLTAIEPATADARGGTVIFLEGSAFQAPLTVTIEQSGSPVAVFEITQYVEETSAFFSTPVLPPGIYDLYASTADGFTANVELTVKRFAEEMKIEAARQKWSPIWKVGPRWLSTPLSHAIEVRGLLQALVEAIHGSDEKIGGQRITRLVAPLSAEETASMTVESSVGFGEWTDGASDARLLINNEIIAASGRTDTGFTGLTRGEEATRAVLHPEGSIVYDVSRNVSAIDRVRRGLLINYATGIDLDVIGANLGLTRCPTIGEEQWRRFIKAIAYLPKQTLDAFREAMTALTDDPTAYTLIEEPINRPYQVTVEVTPPASTGLRGRFYLNAGTPGTFTAHYLAPNETTRDDGNDFYPYLSDPGTLERCALNQVRAAGVGVNVKAKAT